MDHGVVMTDVQKEPGISSCNSKTKMLSKLERYLDHTFTASHQREMGILHPWHIRHTFLLEPTSKREQRGQSPAGGQGD